MSTESKCRASCPKAGPTGWESWDILVKGNLIETVSKEPLAVIQTDNVTMIDGGGGTP